MLEFKWKWGADDANFKIPFQICKHRNEDAALFYRVRSTKEAIPSLEVTGIPVLRRADTFLVRGNLPRVLHLADGTMGET